jgi:hypothetical protein
MEVEIRVVRIEWRMVIIIHDDMFGYEFMYDELMTYDLIH